MRRDVPAEGVAAELASPQVDRAALERIGRELLIAIGENPDREGLVETPKRWAKWWSEFLAPPTGSLGTSFESREADQMVIVRGMTVWSLCEHHLLPFRCEVAVGYIPAGRVLGLSKFARLAHAIASRPQVQERLVAELADAVMRRANTADVAVLAQGEHLCMSMRGARTPAVTATSVTRGRFRACAETRAEFLSLARG